MSDSGKQQVTDTSSGGVVDPLIGLVIDGRYKVVSRMARGGMASVYIAEDLRLDRQVALKIMHPHLAESEQFTARFRQEARSAAKISHPGIVPVYDQGAYQGQGYLVMELIDGPHLRDFVLSSGELTLRDALDITKQLLSALGAAHKAGVIHRDLKPENVLVAPDGSLKITDFGLARAASEITLSSTGTVLGTVAYLAPEVALRGDFDGRTDIYATGIMLYELLTGSVPGNGSGTPIQMALSRVNDDIPAPSKSQDWIPTEVDDLTLSLAARDASDRPVNAKDAAALVERTKRALPAELLDHPLPKPVSTLPANNDPAATQAMRADGQTTWLPIEQNIVHTSGSLTTQGSTKSGQSKSHIALVVTTALLVLAGIAIGFWWWWQQYGPGAYLDVPDLTGKTVAEAQATLSDLKIASVTEGKNDDSVPVNQIISTDPASGKRVHKDGEVTLIFSKGALFVDVPDVAGKPVDEATKEIETAGLKVEGSEEDWSDSVPQGAVISTNPAAGQNVDHRTAIKLMVSKGRQPISLPDLLGVSIDDAKAKLESMELVVDVKEDYSEDFPAGQVAAMDPQAQSNVFKGDTVHLTKSLGSKYVEVPSVRWKGRDDAVKILQDAGLKVEVNEVASLLGVVGRQSIAPGEVVERGTTIVIDTV